MADDQSRKIGKRGGTIPLRADSWSPTHDLCFKTGVAGRKQPTLNPAFLKLSYPTLFRRAMRQCSCAREFVYYFLRVRCERLGAHEPVELRRTCDITALINFLCGCVFDF